MNVRTLPTQQNVPSWFSRMLVLGYYDGPTEGIAECREGHVAVLRMVDWDDRQDVRVFSVCELPSAPFNELERLVAETENPTWPVFLPRVPLSDAGECAVQGLLDKAQRPEYVVACESPVGTVVASSAYPEGVEPDRHDWFSGLDIER